MLEIKDIQRIYAHACRSADLLTTIAAVYIHFSRDVPCMPLIPPPYKRPDRRRQWSGHKRKVVLLEQGVDDRDGGGRESRFKAREAGL